MVRAAPVLTFAVASLVACGSAAVPASAVPATTKTSINYVVAAHPDDEFLGWSLVEGRPEVYPVFVVLTQGDATGFGSGAGHEGDLGEDHPGGAFPSPRYSPELKAQRIGSWHRFLDAMAGIDGHLGIPGAVGSGAKPDGSYPYTVHVGDSSARVVFDSDDGTLSATEVADMVEVVRRHVAPGRFPDLPEGDLIGTSYSNLTDAAAVSYTHSDHLAVHQALWGTDFAVPGHQYGRTTHANPDRDLVRAVTPQTYQAVMGVDPVTCRRTGAMQRAYGWLAFSMPGHANPCPGSWDAAEQDTRAINSRVQHWWVRF